MVELKLPVKSDLSKLLDWENDLDSSEYTDFPTFYTKDQLSEFLTSSQDLLMNNQIISSIISVNVRFFHQRNYNTIIYL